MLFKSVCVDGLGLCMEGAGRNATPLVVSLCQARFLSRGQAREQGPIPAPFFLMVWASHCLNFFKNHILGAQGTSTLTAHMQWFTVPPATRECAPYLDGPLFLCRSLCGSLARKLKADEFLLCARGTLRKISFNFLFIIPWKVGRHAHVSGEETEA